MEDADSIEFDLWVFLERAISIFLGAKAPLHFLGGLCCAVSKVRFLSVPLLLTVNSLFDSLTGDMTISYVPDSGTVFPGFVGSSGLGESSVIGDPALVLLSGDIASVVDSNT